MASPPRRSIGKLFIAGIIPGLLVTALFSAVGAFLLQRNRRRKWRAGRDGRGRGQVLHLGEKLSSTAKTVPFLVVVGLVLGSLYTGWATPSEAAGVGAFLVLCRGQVFYRMYRPRQIEGHPAAHRPGRAR